VTAFTQLELRYGDRANEYKRWWAPVLLTFARPLLDALDVEPGTRALDLGAGVGAFASRLRTRGADVTCVDGSTGMLRRAPRTMDRVAGDVVRLPFRDRTFDLVTSSFVFQHIGSSRALVREAARVLVRGGTLGSVTWGARQTGDPSEIALRVLERMHVPDDPLTSMPTYHHRYDAPHKMRRLARDAGLVVERCWIEERAHAFTAESFLGFVTGMGVVRRRLLRLPERRRARAIEAIARALRGIEPDRLVYQPDVVYLIARRPQRIARPKR
jgi:SAM-dependent methyltransferase